MTDKTITFSVLSVFSVFSLSAHSPILHKIGLGWRFLTKFGLFYATEIDKHNQHHRATLTAYLNTKIANSGTYANFLAINQPTTRYLSKAVKSVQKQFKFAAKSSNITDFSSNYSFHHELPEVQGCSHQNQ